MVTIVLQAFNVCIVGGLHDIMDVKFQAPRLEYCRSLVEQILVFFHFMGHFLKTNEVIPVTHFVSFMHIIIGICQLLPIHMTTPARPTILLCTSGYPSPDSFS